ncbi:MAG: hypothetical protein K0R84_1036 [Clostridia bacterium]|nr:hypothetical protein [Clostridia bacterium]
MSKKLKFYTTAVVLLGITYLIYSIITVTLIDTRSFIIFAVLSIIAESLLILTPDEGAISMGFAIGLAAILVLGVPEAALIASLGIMLRTVKANGMRYHIFNYPLYKTLFNGANVFISAGIAGLFYKLLGGGTGSIDYNSFLLPLIACALVYTVINETIISGLMSIATGEAFFDCWISNVSWAGRNIVYVAPLGILMAIAYVEYDLLGVLLFLGPLLLARYSYKLYINMRNIYVDTVKALSQAIEVKDPYTQGHSMRVSEYAVELGKRLKLSYNRVENLKMAAILHDIGKIGIEESILNKPGRLTEEEFDKIKQHPENGVKIINGIAYLKKVSQIILDHHEKMDGTGYPNGKRQGQICTESAILGIVDVYDAVTSDRPYRNAMSVDQALAIIAEGSGKHFNPRFANEFIRMIEEKERNRK